MFQYFLCKHQINSLSCLLLPQQLIARQPAVTSITSLPFGSSASTAGISVMKQLPKRNMHSSSGQNSSAASVLMRAVWNYLNKTHNADQLAGAVTLTYSGPA